MPEYTELIPEDTTALAIESEAYEYIQSKVPDWDPTEGDPTVWIVKTFSEVISQLFDVVADVSDEIFADFGGNLMGIQRHDATSARATSTWTMVNGSGYKIPGDTFVRVPDGEGSTLFRTIAAVDVLPGETTASVELIADEPGSAGNHLDGPPVLVDALAFVEQITIDEASAGGTDEETMEEYKPRLRELLQLMSPRPIVPEHFEVLARQEPGVIRAVAIPGLDPIADTTDNPLTMAVAVMGDKGLPLSVPEMAIVKAGLERNVPINSVVHVTKADYTKIDVTVQIASLPEFNHGDVMTTVEAQIKAYLAPDNWGRREGWGMVPARWVNSNVVRFYEIVEVINRAVGVDYIVDLEIGIHEGDMGKVDLNLDGHVPLTQPEVITVS